MATLYGPDGNPLKHDAEAPEVTAAQPAEVPAPAIETEPARPLAPVLWWRASRPWIARAVVWCVLAAAFAAVWTLDPDSAVSFGSTVVGLLLAWIGYTADRSGRLKFLGLSFLLLVLLGAQLVRNYSRTLLRFRESPHATALVRLNVSHEVRAFRAHLDGIGVPTVEPAQVDMITAKGQGCGAATTTPEARRDVLMIPTAFPAGIRKGATCAYLGFIVLRLTRPPELPPEMLRLGRTLEELEARSAWFDAHPALGWRSLSLMALQMFLDASYWNEHREESLPPWTEVLWDIRSQAGRQFADRLAAETLVAVAEETAVEGWSSRENFVMEHLRTADSVIDSEQARWPMIRETLRRHGAFPREYPDAQ